MRNLGLIPLRNFGIVDERLGLYRSAQPMYNYEYPWMRKNWELRQLSIYVPKVNTMTFLVQGKVLK